MKRLSLIFANFLLTISVMAAQSDSDLSGEARKVVEYLEKDWSKNMHSTSIPLAMENLGMEENDSLRLEIGQYFRDNPDSARNIRAWGANNYILSNEEKLIAKYLINVFEATQSFADTRAISGDLGIAADRLERRLSFMAEAGFLVNSTDGYSLTKRYGRWGGPLRFNYHTISIGDQDPFDVW